MSGRIAVILKGYPRLSETFIAQELLGLEQAGYDLQLISMRHPTDQKRHPIHDEITAPVNYLPEYLHDEPLRVIRAWLRCHRLPGYWRALMTWLSDLPSDFSRNRVRRFGQALVLADELPADAIHLHAHFIHTPASVALYTGVITGLSWTCSAHAKDIWTSGEGELRDKLAAAKWVVTCTRVGWSYLRSLAGKPEMVHLSYHGLDFKRFDSLPVEHSSRDGASPTEPVRLLTVCRAVEKKGLDVLIDALALLPKSLNWQLVHIGGGTLIEELQAQATRRGVSDRIEWLGAQDQTTVLEHYRSSDVFVLPCRIAPDGDRDGLPNVIVEAQSQAVCCVSTDVSGVPELIENDETGLLVASEDAQALADALQASIADPALRARLGSAGRDKVRAQFDMRSSIDALRGLFDKVLPAGTRQNRASASQ